MVRRGVLTLALVCAASVLPAVLLPAYAAPQPPSTSHSAVPHRGSGPDAVLTHGRPDRQARLHPPRRIRLIVARVYWGSRPPAYPARSEISGQLRQAAAYFDRVSRGRERFHWTLSRWVRARASAGLMCGSFGLSAHATAAALKRGGYHLGDYNRMMVLSEQCNAYLSFGQQPGSVTWIRFPHPGMETLVHELGHNLGLGHAYGLVCRQGGRRVPLGGRCRPVEYGDDWDAMGHSKASYSVPVLQRLGWAGRVATTRSSGTFHLADVEHSGSAIQGLHVVVNSHLSYWVEYQPERSTQVGNGIPGVMIRRDRVGSPLQLIDASPGNPASIAFPDADLENAALPVGSSITTPEHVRFTTVSEGGRAMVRVTFHAKAQVPGAPVALSAAKESDGSYLVHWQAPPDRGQIVLGYRVTAQPSGKTVFVTSPASYHTSVHLDVGATGGTAPTFTVRALNQVGLSRPSDPVQGQAYGPQVSITAPSAGATVGATFDVAVSATADPVTGSAPQSAWADLSGAPDACSTDTGAAPYTVHCEEVPEGARTLTVHVRNANGVATAVSEPVQVVHPRPVIAVVSPAAGSTVGDAPVLTLSTDRPDLLTQGGYTEVYDGADPVGGGGFDPGSAGGSADVDLSAEPQGPVTLQLRTTDDLGDVVLTSVTYQHDSTVTVARHHRPMERQGLRRSAET